jgi:hypothetical protein
VPPPRSLAWPGGRVQPIRGPQKRPAEGGGTPASARGITTLLGARDAERGQQAERTLPTDGPTGQLWGHLWAVGDAEQDGVLPR